MQLKPYQAEALAVLRRFFEEARIAGPESAYERITGEPEYAARLGPWRGSYTAPLKSLPHVPYACLRLPTGGGKTILAAHAVAVARDAWIEKDYPLALWLVPTNTIRRQTVEALKDPRHPYRRVLDETFDGRVRVFDIGDFTHVRPHDLRDYCCIVVGTIQTLRVKDTVGRKVYAHHEDMEPHFAALPKTLPGLETLDDGGGVKYSFANLLHLHRPLMIVDEAHNAVTGLTREMQGRVNPCAIVEFTATPRRNSNILYSVTAQELKDEAMIKLPIRLSVYDTWQDAVSGAVATRTALAKTAERDRDYVRPIVLFQAQKKNGEVTVGKLRAHLLEQGIEKRKIAVATGGQRELDGIDLFDPGCPIEYVITVEALKEGWDCSFAYVFCTVSRIQSAVDVEQLLGRVLRMPYAQRREAAELNRAHAFVSDPVAAEAAQALVDKLVEMGFEKGEAPEHVEPAQRELYGDGDLFGPQEKPKPEFRYAVPVEPEALAILEGAAREGLTVRETDDGKIEIAVTGHVDEELEEIIRETIPKRARGDFAEKVAEYRNETRDRLSPAERGEKFDVPRLMAEVQGELTFADTERFVEDHDWSLLDHSWRFKENEFAIRETARSFEIDLDGNRIEYRFANESEQLVLNVDVEGWTQKALVLWLDPRVRGIDIDQGELLKWLGDLVAHLVDERGMSITALMRCRYVLMRKIRDKLDDIRKKEHGSVYQCHLFKPGAKPSVSFDHAFSFREGMYRDQRRYRGSWKPNKHFLGSHDVPAFDGADAGEEVQCAQAIDGLPQVKYWVRNVSRHPESFWLPTVAGKFYPDFVASLEDGRRFVVEYKGALLADSPDTKEKQNIGALWESKSDKMGLFLMVEKQRDGLDMRAQIVEKIGG